MPGIGFFGPMSGGGGGGGGSSIPDPAGAFGTLPAPIERLYDGHNLWFSTLDTRVRETIQLWVPREDYEATIQAIYGVPVSYPTGWGGAVIRRLPMEHPQRPGLYAVACNVTGRGRTSSTSLYASYLFRIDFETLPYVPTGDTPFMSIRREFSSTVLTRPGRYLSCETDGYILQHDMGQPTPQVSYLLTIFGVSATNHVAIANALVAPVNSSTLYLPDGLIVDPGYAMFQGVADEVNFSFQGFVTKAVTYRILARAGLAFDYILHPRTGGATRVIDPAGNPMVARSDLNALWL
jgi:hypothetical protein